MTIRNLLSTLILGMLILVPSSAQDEDDPAGEVIAFSSNRSGEFEIYTINSDGSNLTRLTENETRDYSPEWSPDGTQIAFTAQTVGTSTRLLSILNVEDGTYTLYDDFDRLNTIFSPDGSIIAYNAQANSVEIFTSDLEANDITQWTQNRYIDYVSDWHPDGQLILFTSDQGGDGNWMDHVDIYILNLETEEVVRLTDTPDTEFRPKFSPDGSQIAFAFVVDDNRDIYVMDADGTNVTRLTTDPGMDQHPSWSPDGTRLVFQSDRYGNDALFIINLETGIETLLTDHFADERYPSWMPAPVTPEVAKES